MSILLEINKAPKISDYASIILSLVAVIVSVVSIVVTFRQNQNNQKMTLEAKYFQEIFEDYLRARIPTALDKISLDEQKVTNTMELSDAMCDLRKDSRFFLYSDKKFYETMKGLLQDIEDHCVNALNLNCTEKMYKEFRDQLDAKLTKLYTMINTRYYGKH